MKRRTGILDSINNNSLDNTAYEIFEEISQQVNSRIPLVNS